VPPAQVPMSERNAGEDTGSRDDLPAEQGGGSEPWEVKPEVANIGSCQSQAAIVTVWKVSAFERECCGDIASLAALLRQFGGCRRTSAST
jgi:hypothetical protein